MWNQARNRAQTRLGTVLQWVDSDLKVKKIRFFAKARQKRLDLDVEKISGLVKAQR